MDPAVARLRGGQPLIRTVQAARLFFIRNVESHSELAAPFRLCSSHSEAAPLTAGLRSVVGTVPLIYRLNSLPCARPCPSAAHPEEHPAVPPRPGDGPRDGGERPVGPSLPLEAARRDGDHLLDALPLAQQPRAGDARLPCMTRGGAGSIKPHELSTRGARPSLPAGRSGQMGRRYRLIAHARACEAYRFSSVSPVGFLR